MNSTKNIQANKNGDHFLESARVARLGTVNQDGTVHIVPIVFVYHSKRIYFAIDRKPKTTTTKLRRLQNIKRNPSVTILIDNYSEDWQRLSYLLIYAKARILSSSEGRERLLALKLLKKKYPQYRSNHFLLANSRVVCLRISRIVAWSAKSAQKSSLK